MRFGWDCSHKARKQRDWMDQLPQQRSNRSNTNNPKEKDSIFYSFTPLAAVAAWLRVRLVHHCLVTV